MNLEVNPLGEGHREMPPAAPEGAEAQRPNNEILPEIRDAMTFDELYGALDRIGGLSGSHRKYSAEELKTRIDSARKNPLFIGQITRTGGLRDKVRELMEKEGKQ